MIRGILDFIFIRNLMLNTVFSIKFLISDPYSETDLKSDYQKSKKVKKSKKQNFAAVKLPNQKFGKNINMIFVLLRAIFRQKKSFGKKLFKKILGPIIPEKSAFFPKISRSKSPKSLNYTKGTKLALYL
jgi:hypothetical protein